MSMKRLLPLGALALLAGASLVGCGSAAAAASKATPTATCPTIPQFQQATGTITAVNSTQMTVQTTKGEALVDLSTRTRYSSQLKTSQADIQDGIRVQVIVKANSDGTYSAVQVAIRQAPTTGTGGTGGTGGGFPGGGTATPGTGRGGRGGTGRGTPVPTSCRTGRGGANGGTGNGGGTGTVEGGLPSGAKVLSGTVATINGPSMTITGTDGTDYNVTLESTTIYSKIGAAKVTDLQIGQAVTATGTKASNGSITAQAVTILLALPTGQ